MDLPQLPFLVVGIKKVFAKVFNYLFLINLLNNSFFSFTSKPAFPIFLQICEITFSQKILQDFNLEFSFLIIKIESSYEKKRKINSVVEKFFTTHNFSAQIQKINLDAVQTEQNFVLLLMLKTYQNSFKLTSGTCLKHSTLLMKFVRFSFLYSFQPKN